MKLLRKHVWLVWTLLLASGDLPVALGNDSAASTAIGGIQLRREANISMEKERLTISEAKVTAEYEFLNRTDKDITTVVAFPIPPYDVGFIDAGGMRDFGDFRLWVEGKELKYWPRISATQAISLQPFPRHAAEPAQRQHLQFRRHHLFRAP